jgi:two-component system, NarL family, sensor histidine kinase UhpB
MRSFLFLCFTTLLFPTVFAQSPLLDSLQLIINQNKLDTVHANALFSLGVNLERSDLKRSTESYRTLLQMKHDPSFARIKGQAAIRLGGNYSAVGKVDSVDYFFGLAEEFLMEKPNDQKFAYNYYSGLGIHYNRIGNHAKALASYQKAASLDPSIIGLDNVAGLHINMANLYSGMDDQKSRMESSYKALEIFEKTQNKIGLAFVYNSLGSLYYSLKDYDQSEKNFLKSMDYRKLSGDRRGEAVVLGNLGNVFTDREDFEEAISYFSKAMEINQELGLKENVGLNLINLGKNYEKMKEYNLSLQYFQKAKDLLKEAGINKHDAIILADMGKLQRLLDQEKEAYQSLLAATIVASAQNNHSNSISAFKNLKDYYQAQGNYQEALEAQSKEYAHRDSLGIGVLQAQLKELESRYALDLKENEISLLKAEKELDRAELARRKANQNLIIAVFIYDFTWCTFGQQISDCRAYQKAVGSGENQKFHSKRPS